MAKNKTSKPHRYQVYNINNPSSYTKIYKDMLFSNAFCSLSSDAKVLYIYMNDWAYHSKNYYNEHEFEFSLGLVQNILKVSLPTSVKLIKELLTGGFIERTNNSKYSKQVSKFKFSELWKNK